MNRPARPSVEPLEGRALMDGSAPDGPASRPPAGPSILSANTMPGYPYPSMEYIYDVYLDAYYREDGPLFAPGPDGRIDPGAAFDPPYDPPQRPGRPA